MTDGATISSAWQLIVFILVAAGLSAGMCRIAVARRILPDQVVARSSHDEVTSRGGGVAFILAFLFAALLVMAVQGVLPAVPAVMLLVLTVGAGALGFIDDLWSLNPLIKLLVQTGLAVATVFTIGTVDTLPFPFVGDVGLGPASGVVTVIWIVAFINIFNFMDGLNGIAGGAAVVGLLAMTLAVGSVGGSGAIVILGLLLAAALAGFLYFNYPGGQIFMGDSGSHGAGYFLAALAVAGAQPADGGGSVPFVFLPVVFLPFIIDVMLTLVRRLRHGKKIHLAHKEHFYQQLHQRGLRHGKVAQIYTGACVVSAGAAWLTVQLPPAWQFALPLLLCGIYLVLLKRLLAAVARNRP